MNFDERNITKLNKIDYVRGYKINDSYDEQRIHMTPLDRGVSILGDYGSVYLLSSCVRTNLDKIEEEIGICSELFDEVCEMQYFLTENKESLEKICKLELIENFELENRKIINGIEHINLRDFNDNEILYNGDGIEDLEKIKKLIWYRIEELLTFRKQIINLNNKIDEVLSDDDYLEGTQIIQTFNENYKKIEHDKLCELDEAETYFDYKELILSEVELCLRKHKTNVDRYIKDGFHWYVIRHFSEDDYLNYSFIRGAYKNTEIKDKLKQIF